MAERVAETYGWSSLVRKYPTSASALAFFAEMRWGKDGSRPVCPRSGCPGKGAGITAQKQPHHHWRGFCRRRFNPLTCTALQNAKVDLRRVIQAAYLLLSCRKGISALQLKTHLDVSHPTAHYLLTGLRVVCGESMTRVCFGGDVEVDEIHIGGSDSSRHEGKKLGKGSQTAVMTLVQRGTTGAIQAVRFLPPKDLTKKTMVGLLTRHVALHSFVYTDDNPVYKNLNLEFDGHASVNHSAGEYVNGKAHVNMAESVHAIVKRGWKGVYHWWSKKTMALYLHEFAFRLSIGRCDIDMRHRMDFLFRGMGHCPFTLKEVRAAKKRRVILKFPLDTLLHWGMRARPESQKTPDFQPDNAS